MRERHEGLQRLRRSGQQGPERLRRDLRQAVEQDHLDEDGFRQAVDKVVAELRAIEVPSKVKPRHDQLIGEISAYGKEIDKAKAAFAGNDAQAIIKAQVDLQSAVTRVSGQINQTIDAINKKLRE